VLVFISAKELKRSLINASLLTLLSLIALFSINYLFAIKGQSIEKYIYYLLVITVSVLTIAHFANNRTPDVFLKRLYFILKLVMIHAIINVIAYVFIKNQLVTISNAHHDCQTFQNIFFYSSLDRKYALLSFLEFDFYRNQGLFWEAGVLQVFLNIYLFLEAFIFKKNRFLIFLAILAILSTYSTTGIAILLIQLIYYIKTEMTNSKVLIPFVLILAAPIYFVFNANVEEKITGEKEASFQKRYFDLVQPLFIAVENPITGIGLDFNKFKEYRSGFYFSSNSFDFIRDETGVELKIENTDEGISNSFMFLLSSMGFPTFFLLLYMFFNQNIFNNRKNLIHIIIILSLITSPLLLRPFFFMIIISGFNRTFYKITLHQRKLR